MSKIWCLRNLHKQEQKKFVFTYRPERMVGGRARGCRRPRRPTASPEAARAPAAIVRGKLFATDRHRRRCHAWPRTAQGPPLLAAAREWPRAGTGLARPAVVPPRRARRVGWRGAGRRRRRGGGGMRGRGFAPPSPWPRSGVERGGG